MRSRKMSTDTINKPVLKTVSEIMSVYPAGGRATEEQRQNILELVDGSHKGRKFTRFDTSSIQICLWLMSHDGNECMSLSAAKKHLVKRGFERLGPDEIKLYGDIVGIFILENATGFMGLDCNDKAEEMIDYLLMYYEKLPEFKYGTIYLDVVAIKGMLRDLKGDSMSALSYYLIVLDALGYQNLPMQMSQRVDVLIMGMQIGE